jgi:hypothetical protein
MLLVLVALVYRQHDLSCYQDRRRAVRCNGCSAIDGAGVFG